ncbi:MAG TPA: acyl carrier protein [Streptosporangiaceae bacterium]|nr:acyl carrier protein [Streptosporangiaceae bacterium]
MGGEAFRRVDPGQPTAGVEVPELQELMAEVLGNPVPADGSFIGYGGDSFLAVVLMGRIEEERGVELDFVEVLESTPESLARSVSAAISRAAQKPGH